MKMNIFFALFCLANIMYCNTFASLIPSTTRFLTRAKPLLLHTIYIREINFWEKIFGPEKPQFLKQPPRADFDSLMKNSENVLKSPIIIPKNIDPASKLIIEAVNKSINNTKKNQTPEPPTE